MVKQGYKQTEIGVIPEDWEVKKVSEISRITTGNKNTQDRIENGIYPFFVRSQTIERINSFSFEGEAVLTAGDGVGVGKVFHYINGKFDYHQRVYAISHFDTNVYGFYFFKYFQNNFYNRIMQMTAKSSVDSVRMETIADMLIPLPPLAEQEAIATALSDADVWIEHLEQLIAKKRLIKQGAMQELLTPPSEELVLSGVEAWEMKKLGEVLKSVGSGTSNTLSDGQSFPIYGSTGVIGFKNYYDYEGHNITVARVGANAGRVNIISGQYCVSDNTLLLVPSNEIHVKFLFYFLIKANLNNLVFGSGQPLITGGQLKVLELFLPNLCEQERIATILSDMDTELENLANQLAKARQIKQGMMQELLTGRTRLV